MVTTVIESHRRVNLRRRIKKAEAMPCSGLWNFEMAIVNRELAFSRRVTIGHSIPINDIEESLNVIGASILIVQIVGVLPNIQTEDGGTAMH